MESELAVSPFLGFLERQSSMSYKKDILVGITSGLLAFLLVTLLFQLLASVARGELREEPFTVSAYQNDGHLVITPNTCGKLSQIVITCDPPAWFRLRADGTLYGRTTATGGHFSAILCENQQCTPVKYFFTATVYNGNTPTLASGETPTKNWGGAIVLVGMFSLLVVFIFRFIFSYDIL